MRAESPSHTFSELSLLGGPLSCPVLLPDPFGVLEYFCFLCLEEGSFRNFKHGGDEQNVEGNVGVFHMVIELEVERHRSLKQFGIF